MWMLRLMDVESFQHIRAVRNLRGSRLPRGRALPPEEVEVTLVDLNTAEAEELATLPGIGEGLAKRIVDYRTEHGPFEGPEGLMEVSGIGEKKLEELRDYITVSNGA